jgi:P-type Ca2+ transporter type 2C
MDLLIWFGIKHWHSTAAGSSIGLTAFSLMLIVAAFESRSISLTIFVRQTFDNARMNRIALIEAALAIMITQMDLFNRLLNTAPLRHGQTLLALGAAVLLLILWELAKLIARRQTHDA